GICIVVRVLGIKRRAICPAVPFVAGEIKEMAALVDQDLRKFQVTPAEGRLAEMYTEADVLIHIRRSDLDTRVRTEVVVGKGTLRFAFELDAGSETLERVYEAVAHVFIGRRAVVVKVLSQQLFD